MNRSVRRVALTLGIAMLALLLQLNYDQVIAAHRFSVNAANRRLLVQQYSEQRGDIVASGQVIARSVATPDKLKYKREYPLGELFAQLTGYYSLVYGAAGLERSFNDYLSGDRPAEVSSIVDELLGRGRKGNSLILTVDVNLQRIAQRMLGGQRGAVAAIDPATGAIKALYSHPSFDPNVLSGHDTAQIRRSWDGYSNAKDNPLLPRAFGERYPPGSTFKIVVSAAALEAGISPDDTFPNPSSLRLPLTNKYLGNFGGGPCHGAGPRISFRDGLRVSCNTTFAQIGMKIGADKLVAMAEKFGIQSPLAFDLPSTASCIRTAPQGCADPALDVPQTALSSIGQFDVRMTPLQMAVIVATVDNGGRVPRPYLVSEVQSYSGATIQTRSFPLSDPIYSQRTADALKAMMINVVQNGTGRPAQIPGVVMGGKTGTAQTGVPNQAPHAWFVAFSPHLAVAVVVENGGSLGSEATGGKVAAPIAKALIQAVEKPGAAA